MKEKLFPPNVKVIRGEVSFDIDYEDWVENSNTAIYLEGTAGANIWIPKVQAIFEY